MKTREGFVSNSSSASFVVKWRSRWPEFHEDSPRMAIARLFDWIGSYNLEKDAFVIWDNQKRDYVPFVRKKVPTAFDGVTDDEAVLDSIRLCKDPKEDGDKPPAPGDYSADWSRSDVERAEMLHDLAAMTTKGTDGWMTTGFWTCMLNDPTDFGRIAQAFSIALLCAEDKFEHVTKVEDD